jgi:hypothetical protein
MAHVSSFNSHAHLCAVLRSSGANWCAFFQKSGETAVKNTGDEPSGESMEETISEEKDKVGHRLPEIHVDYFGPRGHTSRHHWAKYFLIFSIIYLFFFSFSRRNLLELHITWWRAYTTVDIATAKM